MLTQINFTKRALCPSYEKIGLLTSLPTDTYRNYVNINPTMKIPFKKSKKGITLKVKVEPRSSRKGISGFTGDVTKVRVNAPPVGGAANEELVKILSEEFGVRKSAIKIIRGQASKDKVIEIEGVESIS